MDAVTGTGKVVVNVESVKEMVTVVGVLNTEFVSEGVYVDHVYEMVVVVRGVTTEVVPVGVYIVVYVSV